MEKLKQAIDKELKEIAEQGLSTANLEMVEKLSEIKKNLAEAESGSQGGYGMPRYRDGYGYGEYRDGYREGGGYGRRGGYRDGGYSEYGDGYGYGRSSGRGYGGYNGYDQRMRDHMDRIMDGAESYEYGRDRYMHGGDEARLQDGIEKLMYAICMFVESTMEFAETPQEKETIRRHLQKLAKL